MSLAVADFYSPPFFVSLCEGKKELVSYKTA
jgi:hypothetical protein